VTATEERLMRTIERLSNRLDLAEAKLLLLEHHQRRRTLLATLALPTDCADEQALLGLAGVGWEIG